ncbi:MAG: monofunctional biosynthetic peptidoglycan transglycosylase [Desulfobacteraceae bacterium]|nr:MAG: monofunctional biosynthetic peptidoglycan transglycosylase [Desulfobacteraceae bacterium]
MNAGFTKRKQSKGNRTGFYQIAGWAIIAAIAFSILLVFCLRRLPPPTSAFMMERYAAALFQKERKTNIRYHWVGWKEIPPHMFLAVVAAEDQKFMNHWGFDFDSISDAIGKKKKRGRLRGASTITQQVAKNLFLWPGRSYVRKGIEAYFTVLLELLWDKRRILEVYLNIAEFGDGIYGVNAAAQSLLGKRSAGNLTRRDAALLAAVLPNPKQFKVKRPSSYVKERCRWIQRQMYQLGSVRFQ